MNGYGPECEISDRDIQHLTDLYDHFHPELGPLRNALDGWPIQTERGMQLHESTTADKAKEGELRAVGYLE